MAKKAFAILLSLLLLASLPCQAFGREKDAPQRPEEDPAVMLPKHSYELTGAVEVAGRQGVCAENGSYWVSGSAALAKYDKDWNLLLKNEHLLETDSTSWDYVVDEVISRINEIAKLKREKYIEGPNHKPYYIASGKEADLLYIASVLTDSSFA